MVEAKVAQRGVARLVQQVDPQQGGGALAAALQLQPAWGLRAIGLGELVVAASVAFAVMLVGRHRGAGRASLHRVSAQLSMLLVRLAVCGVGFDMLHVVAVSHGRPGMGIAKDGGERAVMSLIVACVVQQGRDMRLFATCGDRRSG